MVAKVKKPYMFLKLATLVGDKVSGNIVYAKLETSHGKGIYELFLTRSEWYSLGKMKLFNWIYKVFSIFKIYLTNATKRFFP